jgi:4-hydroxy-3-polyprenylbenzoate decarboxylase
MGIFVHPKRHTDICMQKYWQQGKAMPVATVIGHHPAYYIASTWTTGYETDEIDITGALLQEPVNMVRCETIDVMVPADAEIVIEGYLNTEFIEPEGPFGESHGYMHPRQLNPFMDVTAITYRKDAIYTSWLSQLTPSESSVIRKIGYDRLMLVHLRDECRITSVLRVEMHEPLTNTYKLVIIQMRKPNEAEVWRALHAACSFHPGVGKIVVAVDEDIDPSNEAAVFWAMCYRMKPHKDVHIVPGMEKGHAPPFLFEHDIKGTDVVSYHLPADESAMLCNAILKEPFPPVSLPKREYMENARKIWEELELPKLRPQAPWFGYSLGQWSDELDQEAQLAVEGRHFETGEKLKKLRVKVR